MNSCRLGGNRRCVWMAVFLGVALGLGVVCWPGLSAGQEEEQNREGYVRNIQSSPPLAEMEKGPGWSYNADYIFAISRSLRDSSLPVAAKVPLFLPTVVLDTALLPISLVAGFFGD